MSLSLLKICNMSEEGMTVSIGATFMATLGGSSYFPSPPSKSSQNNQNQKNKKQSKTWHQCSGKWSHVTFQLRCRSKIFCSPKTNTKTIFKLLKWTKCAEQKQSNQRTGTVAREEKNERSNLSGVSKALNEQQWSFGVSGVKATKEALWCPSLWKKRSHPLMKPYED